MAKRFSMKKPAAKARPRTGKAPKAMFGRRSAKKKANGHAAAPKKSPRSQVLPGMQQVRNERLDHLFEEIAQARSLKNAATLREVAAIQASLAEMTRSGNNVYRHAGVEGARIPGAEKLRVRLTKEEGDAGAEDLIDGEDLDAAADMGAATGGVEA